MKHIKLFEQFVSESFERDPKEEAKLTEHQLDIVMRLADALDKAMNNTSVGAYQTGTIQFNYSAPTGDWMDLRAYGGSIRMWIDQDMQIRPIFLEIEGNTQDELKRMVDLGLVQNLADFIEIEGEYIIGFNVTTSVSYDSKDVPFSYDETSNTEFYSASYLNFNDNGPQEIERLADDIGDWATEWMDESAIPESTIQAMLDQRFPEYEEDEDDEDENENDEDDDDNY